MTQPSSLDDALHADERARSSSDDGALSHVFLASHRGHAAFAREYTRLVGVIAAEFAQLGKADPANAPLVRQSPDRVIVQLGPVALTLAWLRKGGEHASIGELLCILWRGTIAERTDYPISFPRSAKPSTPPQIASEETLYAFAVSEAAWTWRNQDADSEGVDSLTLAHRCVTRLRELHAAVTAASARLNPPVTVTA